MGHGENAAQLGTARGCPHPRADHRCRHRNAGHRRRGRSHLPHPRRTAGNRARRPGSASKWPAPVAIGDAEDLRAHRPAPTRARSTRECTVHRDVGTADSLPFPSSAPTARKRSTRTRRKHAAIDSIFSTTSPGSGRTSAPRSTRSPRTVAGQLRDHDDRAEFLVRIELILTGISLLGRPSTSGGAPRQPASDSRRRGN